jgi:hypothetical protein
VPSQCATVHWRWTQTYTASAAHRLHGYTFLSPATSRNRTDSHGLRSVARPTLAEPPTLWLNCLRLDQILHELVGVHWWRDATRGGLTTQAPQAVAWAGSPAAMEGKARAQCTKASSTWHEHRRGDHTVFSPKLSSVPGSATGRDQRRLDPP